MVRMVDRIGDDRGLSWPSGNALLAARPTNMTRLAWSSGAAPMCFTINCAPSPHCSLSLVASHLRDDNYNRKSIGHWSKRPPADDFLELGVF